MTSRDHPRAAHASYHPCVPDGCGPSQRAGSAGREAIAPQIETATCAAAWSAPWSETDFWSSIFAASYARWTLSASGSVIGAAGCEIGGRGSLGGFVTNDGGRPLGSTNAAPRRRSEISLRVATGARCGDRGTRGPRFRDRPAQRRWPCVHDREIDPAAARLLLWGHASGGLRARGGEEGRRGASSGLAARGVGLLH